RADSGGPGPPPRPAIASRCRSSSIHPRRLCYHPLHSSIGARGNRPRNDPCPNKHLQKTLKFKSLAPHGTIPWSRSTRIWKFTRAFPSAGGRSRGRRASRQADRRPAARTPPLVPWLASRPIPAAVLAAENNEMDRSRLEPLGVPTSGYPADSAPERAALGVPTAADRWIVRQLTSRLGDAPIDVVLWDVPPEKAQPAEGRVTVRIGDRRALFQVLVNPELHFGDLYSAGRIQVNGDLLTLLDAAYRYLDARGVPGWLRRGSRLAPDLADSKRNIHHHYDIGNEFYELWLDREALQYTCAYYADPSMTLEQAQQAKMHHVSRKLRLQPGERVIEAGSGWGGFALFMAKNYGVNVRSFNISHEQVEHA